MIEVSLTEAKTHFASLLIKVDAGEEVIITRRGKPIAKIVAVRKTSGKRLLGNHDLTPRLAEQTLT